MRDVRSKSEVAFGQIFGKRMKALRKERRFTQDDVAQHVGCHNSNIGHIESGRYTINLYHAILIADKLGITIYELAGLTE